MRKKLLIKSLLFFSFLLSVWSQNIFAKSSNHDSGLFMRVQGGLGIVQTNYGGSTISIDIPGYTREFQTAIGGIISPNLALHCTSLLWKANNLQQQVDGLSEDIHGNLTFYFFGGGITYYFMPNNFYISGAMGVSKLALEKPWSSWESDLGPAFEVTFGKEWWFIDNLGVGISGTIGYHSVSGNNTYEGWGNSGEMIFDKKWNGLNFGLRFSATYNRIKRRDKEDSRAKTGKSGSALAWLSLGFEYSKSFGTGSQIGYQLVSSGISINGYRFWENKTVGLFEHLSLLVPSKIISPADERFDVNDLGMMGIILGPGINYSLLNNRLNLHVGVGPAALWTVVFTDDEHIYSFGIGSDIGFKYDITDIFFLDVGSIANNYFINDEIVSLQPYIGLGINVHQIVKNRDFGTPKYQ